MDNNVRQLIEQVNLNPEDFTDEFPDSLEGETVLGSPKIFGLNRDNVLFKVVGGFGALKGCTGTCCFVTRICDGVTGRIERHEIIAVKNVKQKD